MIKDISYYMNLPYTRELIPEPEGGWFIRIKELPGCMSQGETAEEAIQMIEDAMRGWLEVALKSGTPIPEPRAEEEYSGKFVVRVPKSLHRKLAEIAERDGVSLNQWINTALAEAIGKVTSGLSSDPIQEEESWPGLKSAIRGLLRNLNLSSQAAEIDEQMFANWLDRNFDDICWECNHKRFEDAHEKLTALVKVLEGHHRSSPALHSIYRMLVQFSVLIEQNLTMNQQVWQAEVMRQQISEIINSVNRPNPKPSDSERNISGQAISEELLKQLFPRTNIRKWIQE